MPGFLGIVTRRTLIQYNVQAIPAFPVVSSITPNVGAQGQILTVTIRGMNFTVAGGGTPSFSLGSGITVSNTVILNNTTATVKLTIGITATLGFRNLVTTNNFGTSTFTNAFTVQIALSQFPSSGLDFTDMAVLGISAGSKQTLYWDYGNTECFYILATAPQTGITRTTLFRVSPQFAQQWFGLTSPQVIFDPFNYNQSKPSTLA